MDAGLDNPVADIAKQLLSPFVDDEGGTAFDQLPVPGIEVHAERRMGRATVGLPVDGGKGQCHVRGQRFLNIPIGDVLQIPKKPRQQRHMASSKALLPPNFSSGATEISPRFSISWMALRNRWQLTDVGGIFFVQISGWISM
jgi:hypothetical protein